jgi:valyl-tRNA synthetase
MIHPVMPFITEELWQDMEQRKDGETIMYASSPTANSYDMSYIVSFEMAEEAINGIRGIRQEKNLSPKQSLSLKVRGNFPNEMLPVITKLANITSIEKVDAVGDTSTGVSFMVRTVEMFVPLTGLVNVEEEILKAEEALAYQQKFLESVRKKLSNESFVAHAPEAIVALERKKESDSLSKINSLELQLKSLKNN